MRIALLSDTHGNDVAFRAVIVDIKARGADQTIFLGDVATLGAQPQRTVELLMELDCPCIMGNHEGFLLRPGMLEKYTKAVATIESVNWCRDQLSKESLDYLATFKRTLELPLGSNATLLLYHGSPRSFLEDILATTPPERVDEVLDGRDATVMAGGHTHLQMMRQHRGILLVNVGSVGMPFKEYVGGQRPTLLAHAEYAVIEEDGGVVSVTLHRVPLDRSALQKSVAESKNPMREWLMQQYA
jgi:predicted phosphodiesterase